VKIIQKAESAKLPWAIGRQFLCTGCDHIVQVEADDVVFTYKELGKLPIRFIPCPACGTAVVITVSNVRKNLRSMQDDGRIRG
jgi:uncharacterized protein YlaI